jgi:hypothetical protein
MFGDDQPPMLASITMMDLRATQFLADFADWVAQEILFAQDAIDLQLGPTFLAYPAQRSLFHFAADRSNVSRQLPSG